MHIKTKMIGAALTAALLAGTSVMASAETLRWARAGDSLTLDPHSQNEGPTHALAQQIYEPLISPDMEAKPIPARATEWPVKEGNPNVWVFKLREGVTFHEGQDFTAEDVVFTYDVLMEKGAPSYRIALKDIAAVEALDAHRVKFTFKPGVVTRDLPANVIAVGNPARVLRSI